MIGESGSGLSAFIDNAALRVRDYTPALGAVIEGIDLGRPVDDEAVAHISRTLYERGVVFFPGQRITGTQFIAFGRRFGALSGSQLGAELGEIRGPEPGGENVGGRWHTDQCFLEKPDVGALLLARTVPVSGGDTMWAGLGAAFEALSEGMKDSLRGLRAVYSKVDYHKAAARRLGAVDPDKGNGSEVIHPLVGRVPETGREILFADPKYTTRIVGWTREESEPLLRFLFAHVTKPEFTLRFHWDAGSLAMWDNRQTLHLALNDYNGQPRVMHRLSFAGPFLN
jgi:taurine dioxygenase